MRTVKALRLALAAMLLGSAVGIPAVSRLRRVQDAEPVAPAADWDDDWDDGQSCEVEEIQLASDGTLATAGLPPGERVTANVTVNGTVASDEYRFFHACIVRHEHEHAVTVELRVLEPKHGDANLYLSSEHRRPRVGHSTWIAQRVGDDRVRLPTYLDGFPRKREAASRSIPLHIGVRGVSDEPVTFALAVAVEDLPRSSDVDARERYYSQIHRQDRQQRPSRLRVIDTFEAEDKMASLLLEQLATKAAVDDAIRQTKDKVLVLRFGRAADLVCMQHDDILAKSERELSRMARICLVEAEHVPVYCQYFDISLIPATVFFVNGKHMKVDYGTPDHTKFIGAFRTRQDLIDLVEVIYRGAKRGKAIVSCPIERSHIPQYTLIYKDI